MNKTYIDTSADILLSGDVFRSGNSLTSTIDNYALLNNPVFLGSAIYFLRTENNAWNFHTHLFLLECH